MVEKSTNFVVGFYLFLFFMHYIYEKKSSDDCMRTIIKRNIPATCSVTAKFNITNI
jgi:hypothetical protein